MTRFAFSFLVFLIATSAAAGDCFVAAGQRYDIHPWLLYAIADVESSGRPTAVNSGHAERTRSIDIGLMQINSRWLPKLCAQIAAVFRFVVQAARVGGMRGPDEIIEVLGVEDGGYVTRSIFKKRNPS